MSNTAKDDFAGLRRLLHIMDCLRDKELGCPWDLCQDFASIAPHTIEEVYEVVEAIESGDRDALPDELGDLLFQVVFYARLGKEEGSFDFDSIASRMAAKLLRRHPHVFPDGTLDSFGCVTETDPDQVVARWEQIKARERSEKQARERNKGNLAVGASQLDDIPQALPAMIRAEKLQKRAARTGFDWNRTESVLEKLEEELEELKTAIHNDMDGEIHEEFGDLLFTMVNLSRHIRTDSETALRESVRKFEKRFRTMETLIKEAGLDIMDLATEQMDGYWERAKKICQSS